MQNIMTKPTDSRDKTIAEIRPIIGGTMNNSEQECFFCGTPSTKEITLELCKYCKDIYYCGSDHLEYHRPESQCYPFMIKHAPGVGR